MNEPLSSRASFSRAIDLIGRGELAEAEALCRAAVERSPGDVNMLGLLGALLMKTRRHDEAEQWLRRTIDHAPAFAKPHEDLGHLLVERDRAAEAVPLLERSLKTGTQTITPLRAVTRWALAQALWDSGGDRDRARELARGALADLEPAPAQVALRSQLERWLAAHAG